MSQIYNYIPHKPLFSSFEKWFDEYYKDLQIIFGIFIETLDEFDDNVDFDENDFTNFSYFLYNNSSKYVPTFKIKKFSTHL